MTENLTDMPLHAEWQRLLNDMIVRGTDPIEAVEAMLTVGLANKVKVEGLQTAAHSLAVVTRQLAERAVAERESGLAHKH